LLLAVSAASFPLDNVTEYNAHVVAVSGFSAILLFIALGRALDIYRGQWVTLLQRYIK